MKKKFRVRSRRGAAMIALVLALFLFTALAGFFAFDASRAEMAKRELVAACDAASLAGTAMMATYDTSPDSPNSVPLATAQNNAAAYAMNMFQKGSLLGQSLTSATYVSSTSALNGTAPGQCNVILALVNPNANFSGVAAGDPNGKAISVFAAYGYQPAFLPGFFGHVGASYILNASSTGGLPQVDAVMVFDFSGSMDDFTNVTFLRRSFDGPAMWHGTHTSRVRYIAMQPQTDSATLSGYIGWDYTAGGNAAAGTEVNVLPPQNLGRAGGNPVGAPDPPYPQHPFVFDVAMRQSFYSTGYAGVGANPTTDYGTPPGDCTLPATLPAPVGNTGGYVVAGTLYMGGPLPMDIPAGSPPPFDPLHKNWAQASGPSVITNYTGPTPPLQSGQTIWYEPLRPWLLTYQPAYNVAALGSLPGGGGGFNPGVYQNYLPNTNAQGGAWITLDPTDNAANSRYTDLVVNLANPGYPIVQPVATKPSWVGTSPVYQTPFSSYSFPADEPDTRLSGQNFSFPNMATIVEASRGNLDTVANFKGAVPSPYDAQRWGTVIDIDGTTETITAPTGNQYYQLAYQRLAMLESQPFATAVDGAVNGFYYKLNGLADCRFGLVGFSTSQAPPGAGGGTTINATGPNLTTTGTYDVFSYYVAYYPSQEGASWQSYTGNGYNTSTTSPGPTQSGVAGGGAAGAVDKKTVNGSVGQQGFRVPRSTLDWQHNNINICCSMPLGASPWNCPDGSQPGQIWSSMAAGANGLWNGRPMNDTYTAEALNTAINMFTSGPTYSLSNRPASRKAIVFFTDGEPTGGINGPDGNSALTTYAPQAKSKGIAIFTIGLNTTNNTQLTTDQQTFLGDGIAPSGNGLAYAASNGGKFFQCGTSQDVRQAFINVARRLSQNQQ